MEQIDRILWQNEPGDITQWDLDLLDRVVEAARADLGGRTDRKLIAQILDLMAEIFQADTPSSDALAQWFDILDRYPANAVKAGARHLIRTHKFTTFPLPADFIECIEKTHEFNDLRQQLELVVLNANRAHRLAKKRHQ